MENFSLISQTKYSKIYFEIIFNAKSENRLKTKKLSKDYIYFESHHILPKILFPEFSNFSKNKWNEVLLTAREHFICHILLMKHYKSLNHKYGLQTMSRALHYLNNNGHYTSKMYSYYKNNMICSEKSKTALSIANKEKVVVKNNLGEIFKVSIYDERYISGELISANTGIRYSDEINKKKGRSSENNAMFGKKHSEETRKKMSENSPNRFGENNAMFGKKHSEETRKKMSERASLRIGMKNHSSNIIEIYDNDDNLIHYCEGTFSKIVVEFEYPRTAFMNSYKNNSKIHINNTKSKFHNWYCIKKDDPLLK